MTMSSKIFPQFSLIIILLCNFNLSSQDYISNQEKIPRDRLVTDKELITLISLPEDSTRSFHKSLQKQDTITALRYLAEYFRTRKSPSYFFNYKDIEQRAAEFKNAYPNQSDKIIENADEFIKTYGTNIDWLQPGIDLLGRIHTPNTVRYLARQEVAPTISLAYFLTNHKNFYLEYLMNEIRDFVSDFENGKVETGRNDIFERFYAGHRTRNWLFMHQILLGADDYNWQDQILMIKVFILHGARLYDVCKEFNWGNHQLHGLAGLYEMSIMFPEISVMNFWNSEAKRVIIEHIEKEIKPDGFQFERASHYFKLDIINYFRVYQISKINKVELPSNFVNRFHQMFDAIIKLSQPNKSLPVLQDAQDSYQFHTTDTISTTGQPLSNDAAELRDPGESRFMSLGALLFNSPIYKYFGEETFPPDFYWFFSSNFLSEYKNISIEKPSLGSVALDSSNYYVMRTGWNKSDLYMVVDGGLAKYKPDHTHGGILGIIAYANGEEILPNYRVKYSNPSYRTMKNSLVKNVAIADNYLQGQNWISNTARTGFGIWEKLPKPVINDWLSGNHYDFFSGSHNGFESLSIKYERSILFFKPYCWLVVDKFISDQIHSYQQIWQGNYSIDSQSNWARYKGKTAVLDILQADPTNMEITSRKNFWTNSVQFEKKGVKDYSFLTVLYPQKTESLLSPEIRLFERDGNKQIVLFADSLKLTAYIINQPKLKLDEFETDAKLIATTFINDSLKNILIKDGTFFIANGIKIKSKDIISLEVEIIEGNQIKISSLDKIARELFLNGKSIKINLEVNQ
ncbi:MAG: heparinase II/III family protein [Ignavibacteriales bacterium]|nr:heparinase II/III family protein [Ignavibacteriales bacterium]